MSEDDDFEEIVSNEEEGEDGSGFFEEEVESLWEAIECLWPKFHGRDGLLTKGVMLVEMVNHEGEKEMRLLRSPEMAPWDIYGFLKYANTDLDIEAIADMLIDLASFSSADDDDDED